MKLIIFASFFFHIFLWIPHHHCYNFRGTSSKTPPINLQNGPIASKHSPYAADPMNSYPNYRFSQSRIQETENSGISNQNEVSLENKEQGGGGDDKPVFTLNIHAPQESTEDIIDSIKDLKKLVNDERKAADDDFLVEKKKLVEAQRIRIRDLVHSSFEAVNSLIPNPIKSSIRNTLSAENSEKNGGEKKGIIDKITDGAEKIIGKAEKSVNNVMDNAKKSAGGMMNKMKGLLGR